MTTEQHGPCAKVRVFCTLVHPDGRRWTGENVVRRPQATCPRGDMPSGSGYELCTDVCDQVGHAEVIALSRAGADAAGCTAYVEGRDFVCYDCQARLVAAGVRRFVLESPPIDVRCSQVHPDSALPSRPVERRRELAAATLPLDAECALEHAALVLANVDEAAHSHVTSVLAQHLPPDKST